MNQDLNNFNQNNLNAQGNDGVPNNHPLNNQVQSFNNTISQNQNSELNYGGSQSNITPPQNTQVNFDPQTGQPINSFENNKKPKKTKAIKILAIIGGIVVGFIILFIAIFVITSATSEKLVCKSDEGNITIMYNDKTITGYTATGLSYDLDEQKEYAEEIGINAYLTEFSGWFKNNTTGTCTIDGKEVSSADNSSDINIDNKEETNTQTKRVGNATYGYISVPNDWAKFYDVDGNDSIQFSYANVYIVSLNYLKDTTYTAKEYASNYMYNKQNDSLVTGVTGATVQIGKNKEYTAYQVYMYYPSDGTYLVTYWFDAEDGKTHYIALEGPEELSGVKITDYLYIAESFNLNK